MKCGRQPCKYNAADGSEFCYEHTIVTVRFPADGLFDVPFEVKDRPDLLDKAIRGDWPEPECPED